uniref:Uncharacterized protein n=1 Tax=Setaria digitata TaxID=48799 RepID=A0A915PNV3_9BILA
MHPFTFIITLFFTVNAYYMQACASTSDGTDCNDDICLHEKRADDDSKAIRFIRSHLGTMRFGKRIASQFGTMRFGKRTVMENFLRQPFISYRNDESNSIDNSYGKASYFDPYKRRYNLFATMKYGK